MKRSLLISLLFTTLVVLAAPQHDGHDMSNTGGGMDMPTIDTGSKSSCPSMIMYLHADMCGIILFESFNPSNAGEYIGGLVLVAAMSFLAVWLDACRLKVVKARRAAMMLVDTIKSGKRDKAYLFHVGVTSTLTFVGIFLRYLVMLIIMTYNVGIILAACFGFTLGAFWVDEWEEDVMVEKCC
ncbi:hypothetical protein HDU98_000315 [Podochytrium sp. JEL0797]|nr:hypothetical protein HDU98_000315 [Podochytrium sp. JEL0797]